MNESKFNQLANLLIQGNSPNELTALINAQKTFGEDLTFIQGLHLAHIHELQNLELNQQLRHYAVIPGALYAGEIPSALNDEERERKIACLSQLGITKIINLTEPNELNHRGIPLQAYDEQATFHFEARGMELSCIRYPIQDLNIPSITQMRSILNTIEQCITNGGKVYVHCWGGIGRTGTVIGCFLVQQAIVNHSLILAYINYLKRNTNIKDRKSPETPDQERFIQNWNW